MVLVNSCHPIRKIRTTLNAPVRNRISGSVGIRFKKWSSDASQYGGVLGTCGGGALPFINIGK